MKDLLKRHTLLFKTYIYTYTYGTCEFSCDWEHKLHGNMKVPVSNNCGKGGTIYANIYGGGSQLQIRNINRQASGLRIYSNYRENPGIYLCL